jgi:16S rRNA (adenine1518-N6/adenine1519-N6)-dimethyltransferase
LIKHEIKALKHLGQHFLTDESVIQKIVDAILVIENKGKIIEIGPGTGAITGQLLEHYGQRLHLAEIDQRSVEVLAQKFQLQANRFCGDFLQLNIKEFAGNASIFIVGNLPYNIGSQILFRVLDNREWVHQCVFMLQKEVAERICSAPGNKDYGILSVLLQSFFKCEYLFTVGEDAFVPPPRVKSGVMRLDLLEEPRIKSEPAFFKTVVKTAFNQRRKTLRNSLKSMMKPGMDDLPFAGLRPEQLSVEQFDTLCVFLR